MLFTFKQKNHTVTQSTFGTPCKPFPNGFDSGLSVLLPATLDIPQLTNIVAYLSPLRT